MKKYTLREFMEDYKGFDFENGTMVIIRKSDSRNYITTNESPWKYLIDKFQDNNVLNWNHTENVIVITLDL